MRQDADSHDAVPMELVARMTSSYVSHNSVEIGNIPDLIRTIFDSLASIGAETREPAASRSAPPVPIKKSVSDDFIISLEDGRRYKSLKRHLSNRGLTPEQYRAKWNLPYNYPMVAPNYAKQRSDLAKSMGLGRSTAEAARLAKMAKSQRSPARQAKSASA